MVQILKENIRNQITEAAESQFAKNGFKKTTMGTIAEIAGVATGTIYTYFPTKQKLYHTIITDTFVEECSRLTRNRITAFTQPHGMDSTRSVTQGEAGQLLRFWIQNRLKVIILLDRSEDTVYESFAQEYIHDMSVQTIAQAREQFPTMEMTNLFGFMVQNILSESVRMIVSILENYTDEASIMEAFDASSAYQLGGIRSFIEWNCRVGK